MKAYLMYRDHDFEPEQKLPVNHEALTQDFDLETLLVAMADGDKFLFAVARTAVLSGLTDPAEIGYRQYILSDCLAQAATVREIYELAAETLTRAKRLYWGLSSRYPSSILSSSVEALQLEMSMLKRLRSIADEHAAEFRSEGFTRLFRMLLTELDDEYFAVVDDHLKRLRFRNGVMISAELGPGNKGADYVLRRPRVTKQRWLQWMTGRDRSTLSFRIADRDEAGANALSELRGRGINLVANAVAQSSVHIQSFFTMLQTELAFYMGCLNLWEKLAGIGEPVSFPVSLPSTAMDRSFMGLYDPCLALRIQKQVVGNTVTADGASLIMVTGANEGGKSTFLRSFGVAQLMMQCGMFVPAERFTAPTATGLFTHFKREEDVEMVSGKLDEELRRMSDIADSLTTGCVILFNESFAATNEREGSEIARQVIRALSGAGIRVVFVTHLFDLANGFYREKSTTDLFLRAERKADGQRTFRLVEGEPLPTSYGEDLYRRVFGSPPT